MCDEKKIYELDVAMSSLASKEANESCRKNSACVNKDQQDKNAIAKDFTIKLLSEIVRLKITVPVYQRDSELYYFGKEELYKKLFAELRQNFAEIVPYMIKELKSAREIFSVYQQKDEYLSVIYHAVQKGNKSFLRYFIENSVLYRATRDHFLNVDKHVLCVPDELMPPIIYTLYTLFSHPSMTSTLGNFETFYFHRKALALIKKFVRAMNFCA
jgi:hypothetical protein